MSSKFGKCSQITWVLNVLNRARSRAKPFCAASLWCTPKVLFLVHVRVPDTGIRARVAACLARGTGRRRVEVNTTNCVRRRRRTWVGSFRSKTSLNEEASVELGGVGGVAYADLDARTAYNIPFKATSRLGGERGTFRWQSEEVVGTRIDAV